MSDLSEQINALTAITADLDGYLERRANELAQPLIEKAYDEATRRISEAEFEVTRQNDLIAELRRQIKPLARHVDQCRERTKLANAGIEQQVRAKVADEILAPRAFTNAEMAELDFIGDPDHIDSGEVYLKYAARIARGEGT